MTSLRKLELAENVTTENLSYDEREVFTDDKNHSIKYRTLSWQAAAFIMITEVVTGGTLTLPQAIAVVGLVPGTIIIVFCGIWALFTSFLLIDFKLNHPEVHNMGDAGFILFSPFGLGAVGREVMSTGTILFAITGVGSMSLLGQLALQTLSQGGMCAMSYLGIWSCATFLVAIPRTFGAGLQGFSMAACISILVATLVAMIGSGVEPTPNRVVVATAPNTFYTAFLAITNPVLAYAGHFLFFTIISEMKVPRDSKKSAWALQIFSTTWYVVFAVVSYCYLGATVQSPSFLSLSDTWAKVSWGLALPNLLVAGALYNHFAAKIVFVRMFRESRHLTENTMMGWGVWILLLAITNGCGFVLATGVPRKFFSYLGGIVASAFASWYTYGLAGAFWWHDTHHLEDGWRSVKKKWPMFLLCFGTLIFGGFICVGGLYAIIKSLIEAYASGAVGHPFTC
ncbi:transmembrane amino acid transporter [Aureobasidium sp. EXF-12298]|nr:transmembrane amino acid transporter [Aureobasidium sp. EXF-12298]